ncbi:hypothetical protein BpHYR1_043782 [Brachionus plicatilis]|uniref:Uncharacterized protein n=1 Tax=Brachionus plicatilis TaxID=10195 RepID=A0A3M7RKR0_BRAPC|nr:hypothetical protein BpHYR1_043782 [Brachionus plicatilis]
MKLYHVNIIVWRHGAWLNKAMLTYHPSIYTLNIIIDERIRKIVKKYSLGIFNIILKMLKVASN